MIPVVHTQWLAKELETDGHNPMHFLCDDGNYYFCKYRTQLKKEELDCLVYELVCHFLLRKLNIPTPDVAFAVIDEGSYDIKKLNANSRYIKPDIVCFASKETVNTTLVTGIQSVDGKTHVRKFENIYDLLKIAMFDLWVDNDDRGKGSKENYNLLLQSFQLQKENSSVVSTKYRWLAFDHAFTFGGAQRLRMFNEKMMPSASHKLIESQYYNSFRKYFIPANYEMIIENFLLLSNEEIFQIIQSVFSQIPPSWNTPPHLADRIITFLSNPERIRSVKQLTIKSFK